MKRRTVKRIIALTVLGAMLLVAAISGEFLLVNAAHGGHNNSCCAVCRSMMYARTVLFGIIRTAVILSASVLAAYVCALYVVPYVSRSDIGDTPVCLGVRLNN